MPKITLKYDSDNKTVNLNSLKCSLPVSSFLNKTPNNANIYIGTKNVERWELARQKLLFKNDVDFVTYLLNLIDKQFNTEEDDIPRNNNNDYSPKSTETAGVDVVTEEFTGESTNEIFLINNENRVNENQIEVSPNNDLEKKGDNYLFLNEPHAVSSSCLTGSLSDDQYSVQKEDDIERHKRQTENQDDIKEWADTIKQLDIRIKRKKRNLNMKVENGNVSDIHIRKHKRKKGKHNIIKEKKLRSQRMIKHHDIRKAPKTHKNLKSKFNINNSSDLVIVTAKQDIPTDIEAEENSTKKLSPRAAIKIRTCNDCNSKHVQGACPFTISENYVNDCVSLSDWIEEHKDLLGKSNVAFNIDIASYTFDRYMNEEERSENNEIVCESKINTKYTISTYSEASLPYILEFQEIISSHGLSVIAKSVIPKCAKLGPLVGKKIKETDIPDDCTMRDIWEVFNENERLYFSTENPNESNWVRFLRPAPNRENRNLAVIIKEENVFLVTTKQINESEELLYWIDEHNSLWGKKKLEKSSCGGCNLRFAHALYYRTHCSVFHDPAFSLTIRKYHCKVCGEAVLGKENIMKHAAEMHDGKGAYQCQFCKKFFLRLNYLEMHRTYGCSANPQRSRPLCDFCGRKFCQPQKLKVHIKRMHSDMAEVLRDFQCKLCSKILGSRAALQRHNKEVHSKDVGAVSACPRCGKVFQNKSNLKIHMLTHSGVKPFKCQEINCNAAFTTKQCLQFHYKKVHGYTQDMMPKIERSVAYTFDAYSGGRDDIQSDPQSCRKYSVNSFVENNKNENLLLLHSSDSESLPDIKEVANSQEDDCPSLISTLPDEHMSSTNQISPLLETFHGHERTEHNQINSTNKAQANDDVLFMENHMLLKNGFVKDITNSNNSNQSLISKGSKKWLGQTKIQLSGDVDGESDNDSPEILHYNDSNILESRELLQDSIYSFNPPQKIEDNSNIILDVGESHSQDYDNNVDLEKINMEEQLDASNSAGGDDLNPFNNHRVSSSASMLVEAALDSVAHIDMTKDNGVLHDDHNSDTGVIIVDQLDMHSTSSDNNISQSNMLSNINISSDSINIDTMDGYNMNMSHDTDIHNNSLTEIKIKQADLVSRNNTPNQIHNDIDPHSGRYNIQCSSLDSNNMVINKHEIDLTEMNHLQAQNMLDLHGRTIDITSPTLIHESEIDVGSLDSSSLHRSVENYTSLHQDDFASPKPADHMTRSLGQEYTIHHDALESPEEHRSRIHYSLPEDTDIGSPAGTPVPRYDFNNHLPTDNLSSDDEGMVQNLSLNIKEKIQQIDLANSYSKQYETNIDSLEFRTKYELDSDFRSDRNFEPLILSSGELQGLDMSSRNYHHNFQMSASTNLNRYHHIYDIAERQSVDLSLTRSAGYASPPSYAHSDVLRVVSLDLTPGGRHSVDLGLPRVTHHSHSSFTSQIQNSRLISDQSGRLISEHRLLSTEHRLLASDHSLSSNRLITDPTHLLMEHTMQPNRLLSPDPHTRLLADQSRLLDQTRLLQATPSAGADLNANRSALVSPRGFPGYTVSSSTFHPVRPTVGSPSHTPNPATYHPYSGYY